MPKELKIKSNLTEGITDPIDSTQVFQSSLHSKNQKSLSKCSFHFQKAYPDALDKEARNVNPKKATAHKIIPSKILKIASDICVELLAQMFDNCIENSYFPGELERANVTSLHKNELVNSKTNFRSSGVLPTV